jgi:hypothetical protein
MKLAIHQPNFLPWGGYFNKIKLVDNFIFLDDVQFERGKTFTSRTKILSNGSPIWLTVPVLDKSSLLEIRYIRTDNSTNWKGKHLKTIFHSYKKAKNFDVIYNLLEEVYSLKSDFLNDFNQCAINSICSHLNISTKLIKSSSIECEDKTGWDKLLEIIIKSKADTYVSGSGSGSKRYVNLSELKENGVELQWQEYSQTEYNQLHTKSFVENLSMIDYLFNV